MSTELDKLSHAQEMEKKQPGLYWVDFLSKHWNPKTKLFRLPLEEEWGLRSGKLFEFVDMQEAYDRFAHSFKNIDDPRKDFEEGEAGDKQFESALVNSHLHNVFLANYLKSLGWRPEYSWSIEQEICQDLFPDLLEEFFPE